MFSNFCVLVIFLGMGVIIFILWGGFGDEIMLSVYYNVWVMVRDLCVFCGWELVLYF